ncbi:MAG: molybdopterin-dependent oxidoreductase [Candidatus Cloacimonetes bacterium]|nr:molybdopterin-dependent oxidoreductase [Candidatus Cloacimonadota bacterium]
MSKLHKLSVPIFWAEGRPGDLKRETWEIEVTGKCKFPQTFTWEKIVNMPKKIADARLTSVTRFSVRGKWGGVSLSDILNAVEPDSTVKYVRFWSVGMIYDTSIPIDIARQEKTLLAYEFDGELLDEDYGGPVRVFNPYLWGYKSAKSIVKIELMEYYIPGFWESRGYTDSAEIEAGKVRDMNQGGKVRPIPDGEVIKFLDD